MKEPISPEQAAELKPTVVPPAVYEAFNHFLILRSDGDRTITITQPEVVARIEAQLPNLDYSWLNVEDTYRKLGWTVEYDRPGFNETYDAFWTFSPKRKGK